MITIFEFLGREPIENVITCMHFKVDTVIFFGYADVIKEQEERIRRFLTTCCGVGSVGFRAVSGRDLDSILENMRGEIGVEMEDGHRIFFDVTGGEDLLLVAFGILSREMGLPMHIYELPSGELIELERKTERRISVNAEAQDIKLSIDELIRLHGGVINRAMQKDEKALDERYQKDAANMWKLEKRYIHFWNPFSAFLRNHMVPDDHLRVDVNSAGIQNALEHSHTTLNSPEQLRKMLQALSSTGLLQNLKTGGGRYRFTFRNEHVKEWIWDGGSLLELHTYKEELEKSDECMVGVHLDWDGVIHSQGEGDVLNEIDVLSLTGCVPTFISCKTGKMNGTQSLFALYELETVARRFGGKYAKKVLVSMQPVPDAYRDRAAEMGIEVR